MRKKSADEKVVPKTITMAPALSRRVHAFVEKHKMSFSALASAALDEYIESSEKESPLSIVPVLQWDEILGWPDKRPLREKWAVMKGPIGPFGFAVKSLESHWPFFNVGTYLFFDKPEDFQGNEWVVAMDNGKPNLARLCVEGDDYFVLFMPANDQSPAKLKKTDLVAKHLWDAEH